MFAEVVLSPQWLQVGIVYRLLELGLISQVKAGQGADMVEVPATMRPVFPRHALGELGLNMRLELFDRAAQPRFQVAKLPVFFLVGSAGISARF